MPITSRIDHQRRLVLVRAYGTLTGDEVFERQRTFWSDTSLAGYDELIDVSNVSAVEQASEDRIQELASVAAGMDSVPSRFAVVAPSDLAFGLGRMFQAYRETEKQSTKEVGVFRTLEEALAFLGIQDTPSFPPIPSGLVTEER